MVPSVSLSLSYAMNWNNLLFLLQHTPRLLTRWFHALNPATSIGVEERTQPSMHSHEDLGPAAPENVHSEALLVGVDRLEVVQSRDDEDGRRAGVRGELGRQALSGRLHINERADMAQSESELAAPISESQVRTKRDSELERKTHMGLCSKS